MLIDHIGYFVYPDMWWLRAIGRLAFPLFAFLIGYGAIKTRNIYKYLARLLAFAICVQLGAFVFEKVTGVVMLDFFNVFFTLASGVICIILSQLIGRYMQKIMLSSMTHSEMQWENVAIVGVCVVVMVSIGVLAGVLNFDYGSPGILLIMMFYYALQKGIIFCKQASIFILIIFNLMLTWSLWHIQWFGVLSVVFILLFDNKRIRPKRVEQYAYYIFYPLHILIINLLIL